MHIKHMYLPPQNSAGKKHASDAAEAAKITVVFPSHNELRGAFISADCHACRRGIKGRDVCQGGVCRYLHWVFFAVDAPERDPAARSGARDPAGPADSAHAAERVWKTLFNQTGSHLD